MGENLQTRIQYWLNEAKHDCFFVVGPENGPTERIGAIKHLLMGDSEPLRAMLQDSELAEKKDVCLKDVEPETFWNFLKCVYGASMIIIPKLNFEESAKLLYVVEKYLVNDVKSVLTEHMNDTFSFDTLFVALSHPVCCEEGGLKAKITRILEPDIKEVISNDQFLDLSYAAIKWILQMKYLMIKEIELWKAVVRWAEHKTGSSEGKVLRSQMIGLLKYICFLTMDQSDFSKHVVSSEILNEEEINELCCAFVLGKHNKASEILSCNTTSRFDTAVVSKHVFSSFMEFPNFAFIRCSVSEISKIETDHQHISETYFWASHTWHLDIRKVKNDIDSLEIFLFCIGYKVDCDVDVEIILINQSTKSDKRFSYSVTFCSMYYMHFGFDHADNTIIGWSELINPDSGFVKDDCISILVRIQLK